jgi:hypothetical protein
MTNQLPTQNEEKYLGDGVYVRFDGFQLILRAIGATHEHFVVLEPEVFLTLINWIRQHPELEIHMGIAP